MSWPNSNGGKNLKAYLESIERPGPKIRLTKRISVVGRMDGTDVRIDHASLSRRHAVLVIAEGLVVVRDLITTNGTRVNGKKVRWAALMPNDTITRAIKTYREKEPTGKNDLKEESTGGNSGSSGGN